MQLPPKVLCSSVAECVVGESGAVGVTGSVPTILYESKFHMVGEGEAMVHAVLTVQSRERAFEPGRYYVLALTHVGTVE